MAGSKKKGPAQVATQLPSSKAKQLGTATAAVKVKAKSPLQQVTNASISPSPSKSSPPVITPAIAPAIEVKGKVKPKDNLKELNAENNISNVDRLKRLEAKIDALNSVVVVNLPRVDHQKQNLDPKFKILERKIDRIESLLQTVVRSLAEVQEVKRVEKEQSHTSYVDDDEDDDDDDYLPTKKEEKSTDPPISQTIDSSANRWIPKVPANSSSSNNLALSGCVRIPPKLLRLFMTSMLLVNYLQPLKDGHAERIPLIPKTLPNVRKDYRRDLQDKLAYLCDRLKGGTTITAIGFEDKDGKVVIHAASNCSQKCSHIPSFLKKTIDRLSLINQDNKKAMENAILEDAILLASSKETARLTWYAEALHRCLSIQRSWINSDSSVSHWLQSILPKINTRAWKDLVDYCYEGRKDMFAKIQSLITTSSSEQEEKELILHKLGRIGAHRHAAAVICNAATLLNTNSTTSWLEGAEVKFHNSPPRVQCLLNMQEDGEEASLDEVVSVVFKGDQDLSQCSDDLKFLSARWGMDMKIANRLKENREFPTKVHAELILIDHFDTQSLRYYDDDNYIGCSKPACYLCFQYIKAINRVYQNAGKSLLVEPATHNNIYTEWRPPDIASGSKNMESRALRRNDVLGTMTGRNIAVMKTHLRGYRKQVPDSTNGESVATDFSQMMHKLGVKNDRGSQNDGDSVVALDGNEEDIDTEQNNSLQRPENLDEDVIISDVEFDSDVDSGDDESGGENDCTSPEENALIADDKKESMIPDTEKLLPLEETDAEIVETTPTTPMEGRGIPWILGYFRGLKELKPEK